MVLNDDIRKLIVSARNKHGSWVAMSKIIGCEPSVIGKWADGRTKKVDDKNVPGLAAALDLTFEELYSLSLGGTAPSRPTPGTDRHTSLANFLRSQPEANQDIIFKLAQSWGWEG